MAETSSFDPYVNSGSISSSAVNNYFLANVQVTAVVTIDAYVNVIFNPNTTVNSVSISGYGNIYVGADTFSQGANPTYYAELMNVFIDTGSIGTLINTYVYAHSGSLYPCYS
jgi:hypothetical protein